MREIDFEIQNKDRWKETDELIRMGKAADPDELILKYNEINDDLAFARTHFPDGNIEHFLNQLLSRIHQSIYRNKKERPQRIKTFWLQELPLLWYKHRKYLLYSFLFFIASALLGILSAIADPSFTRSFLGDAYMNMTIENIDKGDPMAVYKSMQRGEMFWMITINNIRVSFLAFAGGVLAGFGTIFILFQNGVMLGSFQYIFYEFDLLWETVLVIWIHGTIEISAIIIAGAAGLVMGAGLLFPGSYPRLTSFVRQGRDGLKMVIGLVPFFILAGLLESFVTRYTNMPVWLSLCIIIGSATLIIFYFILLPFRVSRLQKLNAEDSNAPI